MLHTLQSLYAISRIFFCVFAHFFVLNTLKNPDSEDGWEFGSFSKPNSANKNEFFAISNGYTKFTALAVATKNGGNPCGACRQVIWDLCGEISIYITDVSRNVTNKTSSELLPNAFDKGSL